METRYDSTLTVRIEVSLTTVWCIIRFLRGSHHGTWTTTRHLNGLLVTASLTPYMGATLTILLFTLSMMVTNTKISILQLLCSITRSTARQVNYLAIQSYAVY